MKIDFGVKSITISDLQLFLGGRIVKKGDVEYVNIDSVCTDSREVDKASVFVAMKGEKADGHDFIESVINFGCMCVICERIPENIDIKNDNYCIIVVPDTIKALCTLAKEYKKMLKAKTVAITGSVGKTTTKEFAYSVLSNEFKVYKTEGNYNSLIGMPMSLLETSETDEIAVYEMGMSKVGEIKQMSHVAHPDFGIITNIGSSHIESLGSRENIAEAKLEIVDGMKKGSVLILNGDEPLLKEIPSFEGKKYYVSCEDPKADFYISDIRHTQEKSEFDIRYKNKVYRNLKLPFVGNHGVIDAAYAFALGILLGVTEYGIRLGLANFKNADMRQNIYNLKEITIIEDCYNASPESMKAAIDALIEYSDKSDGKCRCVAVLGDMLELGDYSRKLHYEIGKYLSERGIDLLFTFGALAEEIGIGAADSGMKLSRIYSYRDCTKPEAVGDLLIEHLEAGDVVLFKASRGVYEERIISYVKSKADKLFRNKI